MKRQGIALLCLVGALAASLGLYFGLRAWNQRERETPPAAVLAELEGVESLSFTASDGQDLSFAKDGSGWYYTADPEFPLDGERVDAIVAALSPLTASRKFEEPDTLEAYGLGETALRVTAESGEGEQVALLIGNTYNGDYYAKLGEGKTVYTIAATLPDAINHTLLDLAALPTLPGLEEGTLLSVTLERAGETVRWEKTTQTTPAGEEGGDATTTYHWSRNGEALEEDARVTDLLGALRAPSFTACYDYKGAEESVTACGLETAAVVTVAYDGGSYRLTIGNADESGAGYYVQLDDDPAIYTLAASLAEPLLALE